MKSPYLIGGTMGVGKTAVCRERKTIQIDTIGKSCSQIAEEIKYLGKGENL